MVDAALRKELDHALTDRDVLLKDAIAQAVRLWLDAGTQTEANRAIVPKETKEITRSDVPPIMPSDTVETLQEPSEWVSALLQILESGHQSAMIAIKNNLAAFRELVERAAREHHQADADPRGDDQSKRMDRLRKLGKRSLGSGGTAGKDAEKLPAPQRKHLP